MRPLPEKAMKMHTPSEPGPRRHGCFLPLWTGFVLWTALACMWIWGH